MRVLSSCLRRSLQCLSDPGVPGVRSMGPDVTTTPFADLTDVTLADEDSNSTPVDDVNRVIPGNVTMQVKSEKLKSEKLKKKKLTKIEKS